MTTVAPPAFRWNKEYEDYEQVAHLLPAFRARLAELTEAGQYRYNDSFKGHIPGAEGPNEDTAIYLLQRLDREREQELRVARLLLDGYTDVDALDKDTRYSHIVIFTHGRTFKGEWQEWREARLTPRDGRPYAVIPKGKRTHGHLISGRRVLVKP